MNSNNKKIIRNLLIYLGIPILLVVLLLLLFDRGADQTGLKYSDVLSYFEDGKVSAYSLNLGTGEMKLTVTEDSSKKESVVRYTVPNVNLFYNDVSDYIKSYNEEHPNNRMTQAACGVLGIHDEAHGRRRSRKPDEFRQSESQANKRRKAPHDVCGRGGRRRRKGRAARNCGVLKTSE